MFRETSYFPKTNPSYSNEQHIMITYGFLTTSSPCIHVGEQRTPNTSIIFFKMLGWLLLLIIITIIIIIIIIIVIVVIIFKTIELHMETGKKNVLVTVDKR